MKILRFAEIKLQVVLFSNKKIYIHTLCQELQQYKYRVYLHKKRILYESFIR